MGFRHSKDPPAIENWQILTHLTLVVRSKSSHGNCINLSNRNQTEPNRTESRLTVADDDRGDDAGCRGGAGGGSGRGQGGHCWGRSDDVAHRACLEHVGMSVFSFFVASQGMG